MHIRKRMHMRTRVHAPTHTRTRTVVVLENIVFVKNKLNISSISWYCQFRIMFDVAIVACIWKLHCFNPVFKNYNNNNPFIITFLLNSACFLNFLNLDKRKLIKLNQVSKWVSSPWRQHYVVTKVIKRFRGKLGLTNN